MVVAMMPAWRRNIQLGERRSRPVQMSVCLSLGPELKKKFFDQAETLGLHPNQLATQIVEAWLVDRKKVYTMPDEHYTARHDEEMGD
jgi:hypothetical protein